MAEPVSWVTTIAIAIVAAERIISEIRSRRAATNGAAPFRKRDAEKLKGELLSAIQAHADAMKEHVSANHTEHADLHDRITTVQTSVAHIEGRLEAP